MRSGKRSIENEKEGKKINIVKIMIAIILIVIAVIVIYFTINKSNNKENKIANESIIKNSKTTDTDEIKNEIELKTIEEIISEFGGEIIEQAKNDTYYIKKDGVEYTAYLDGEILEGRIVPWNGGASQPAIDEAGNLNIYNAEELKWVADQVISGTKNFAGVTITLRNHIDLGARKNEEGIWEGNTWSAIIGYLDELQIEQESDSNSENTENAAVLDESIEITEENLKRFAGAFDGNGFSIRGMNIDSDKKYQGLFGYSTGTIANLTVKSSNVSGNEVAGIIVGLNGGTIKNCSIENIEVKGKEKIGGFAGVSMSASNILECSVNQETSYISGEKYIGGIVGYVNNNATIQKCINRANTTGEDYVGGICGIAFYGTVVEDSINYANNITGNEFVGGLIGYSQAQIDSCNNWDFENNNKGTVKGKDYVGGIVGLNYIMGNITNSYNSGKIIIDGNNGAGIVGLNNATISNCYNTGNIENDNKESVNIGGICGQNTSESFIYTSYNIGKINSKSNIGGAIGSDFGSCSNVFYLESSVTKETNDISLSKNEEDMKNAILTNLGDAYIQDSNNINSGYPILIWQETEL